MPKFITNLNEVTYADAGSYIRVSGFGILDGLKGEAVKIECYKIMEVVAGLRGVTEAKIYLKPYHRKGYVYICQSFFQQKAEIYTPAEFELLPIRSKKC